jgi:ubiquitin C-terminal hydrolase
MFGLTNFRGSCWVNACLQGIFRIPELQNHYKEEKTDGDNPVDVSLSTILKTRGQEGLKDFFISVRTDVMPAGQNVGDSHELLVYLCDKLPFLDELCRFKVAELLKCNSCDYTDTKEDSVIEFSLQPSRRSVPISECISEAVSTRTNVDWKCEKCSQKGCTQQLLIGTFPKVMMFHITTVNRTSLQYSSILVINKQKYCLISVISYNGSHWWAYTREMPPGKPWYTIDDTRVQEHRPNEFPMSETMRVLIYYRLDE